MQKLRRKSQGPMVGKMAQKTILCIRTPTKSARKAWAGLIQLKIPTVITKRRLLKISLLRKLMQRIALSMRTHTK